MKNLFINKYTLTILGIFLFFAIWTVVYFAAGQSNLIFPGPITTLKEAFSYFGDPYLYKCIWGSLYRMLIGFSIASIAGIALGMIVGNYLKIKHVFNPTMIALKAVPTAALIYMLMVLVGFKNAPIYIVMIIVFPMVYEATVSGYSNLDEEILMALRVDSANGLISNFKVKLPLAFPHIALGLVSSFALSFKIEIMAEVLTSSSSVYGLGRAISISFINQYNGLISTFAYSFIAISIMLLVSLIIYFIKKFIKIKSA